eukprot:3500371-Alexandrium_andersonii.AAC.1
MGFCGRFALRPPPPPPQKCFQRQVVWRGKALAKTILEARVSRVATASTRATTSSLRTCGAPQRRLGPPRAVVGAGQG